VIGVVIGVVLFSIILIAITIGILIFLRKNTKKPDPEKKNDYLGINKSKILETTEYAAISSTSVGNMDPNKNDSQYIDADENNLSIIKKIGSGNFGEVYLGEWKSKQVALKNLVDSSSREAMKKEIEILASFYHPNIVKYFGIGFKDGKEFIILEYVNGGDLLNYMLDCEEKNKKITFDVKLDLMKQICYGMTELHRLDILHRDLSARNVLLHIEDEKLEAKLTDFGLSRSVENYYTIENATAIPVRWTAPEIFSKSRFYKQSDVWSFGVVCWEICSNGSKPFMTIDKNKDVIEYIVDQQKTLSIPKTDCPDSLWNILQKCFIYKFQDRPTFQEIEDQFKLIFPQNPEVEGTVVE